MNIVKKWIVPSLIFSSLMLGLGIVIDMLWLYYNAFTSPAQYTTLLEINTMGEAHIELVMIIVIAVLLSTSVILQIREMLKRKEVNSN